MSKGGNGWNRLKGSRQGGFSCGGRTVGLSPCDATRVLFPHVILIRLRSEVENEDLVFTLEAIVEKFGEDIAPFAVQMTQQLTAAFWKYANTEGDDDDDICEGGDLKACDI